jgi:type II secretory pathway component PulC
VDRERLAAIDAADDNLELRLALLGFAEALEAAMKPPRRRPHAPQVAEALLAAGVAAQLFFICKAFVSDPYSTARVHPASGSNVPTHRALDVDVAAVGRLFGAPVNGGVRPAQAQSLVLTGVIATGEPAAGFGILGTTRQHTSLYPAGAELPGGARLAAVYRDRVEIEMGGMRQALFLPRRAGQVGSMTAATRVASADPIAELPTGAVVKATTPEEDWLTRHVMAEATDSSGRPFGLSLSGGSRKNGLRLGDVLTAINGVPVPDRKTAVELLSQPGRLSQGDPQQLAQLTVLRNGNPVNVVLHPEL